MVAKIRFRINMCSPELEIPDGSSPEGILKVWCVEHLHMPLELAKAVYVVQIEEVLRCR